MEILQPESEYVMPGFSPMWLAPIDGTPILLKIPGTNFVYYVGRWKEEAWWDDEGVIVHQPLGWMNLMHLDALPEPKRK